MNQQCSVLLNSKVKDMWNKIIAIDQVWYIACFESTYGFVWYLSLSFFTRYLILF